MSEFVIKLRYEQSGTHDIITAKAYMPNGRTLSANAVSDLDMRLADPQWFNRWKDVAGETVVRKLLREIRFSEVL